MCTTSKNNLVAALETFCWSPTQDSWIEHSRSGEGFPKSESSANFGDSDWHETSISVHSKEAHDWYVTDVFDPLWRSSHEVTGGKAF